MTPRVGRRLRIAITNPFCWPYVRRGSERFIGELSNYLAGRGHTVVLISSAPEPYAEDVNGNVSTVRYRQRITGGRFGSRLTSAHVFSLQCLHALLRDDFDVVHCMSYFDGFAAGLCKYLKRRTRYILHVAGIPIKGYFRPIPHDYLMFKFGLKRADRVVMPSRFSLECLEKEFHGRGEVVYVPVDLSQFKLKKDVDPGPPKILMVGHIDEARKGAGLLFRAFAEIKKIIPEATLKISGGVSDGTRRELFSLVPESIADDIEVVGVGRAEDLPGLYAEATVTVLPAIWEAFGMVLLESMACGTPVVGAAHGGITDIISSPDVGFLFDPGDTEKEATNLGGLVDAILSAIELSRNSNTRHACRRHAESFGWETLGPRFEKLYYEVLGQ